MSIKYFRYLKRAPDNIEKTKISQNVDADHHFKLFLLDRHFRIRAALSWFVYLDCSWRHYASSTILVAYRRRHEVGLVVAGHSAVALN